jgi:hypothetical protein
MNQSQSATNLLISPTNLGRFGLVSTRDDCLFPRSHHSLTATTRSLTYFFSLLLYHTPYPPFLRAPDWPQSLLLTSIQSITHIKINHSHQNQSLTSKSIAHINHSHQNQSLTSITHSNHSHQSLTSTNHSHQSITHTNQSLT